MSKQTKQYEIYTDGSCIGNPGPGGWAAIFLIKNNKEPIAILKGHKSDTTNNRMEMTAVIEALNYVRKNKFASENFILYCDSNLIVQTVLRGWKKKANLDLWKKFDELNKVTNVRYVWVKAHHENYWNNQCDRIAQKEAQHQ